MEIGFFSDNWDVEPRRAERLRFGVFNDTDATLTCDYRLESEDQRFDPAWCELHIANRLAPQAHVEGLVEVRLPASGGPPAGSYRVRVVAVDRASRSSAAAICTIRIARSAHRPRLELKCSPSVTLNPDGSLTASLQLSNSGNMQLTGTIKVRHSQGWQFDLDQPEFVIRAGGDWIGAVRLRLPSGWGTSATDNVTVEIESGGEVLVRADVAINPSAPIPPDPPNRQTAQNRQAGTI